MTTICDVPKLECTLEHEERMSLGSILSNGTKFHPHFQEWRDRTVINNHINSQRKPASGNFKMENVYKV